MWETSLAVRQGVLVLSRVHQRQYPLVRTDPAEGLLEVRVLHLLQSRGDTGVGLVESCARISRSTQRVQDVPEGQQELDLQILHPPPLPS